MNINIVNEYPFVFTQEALFSKIINKICAVLSIDKPYSFSCIFVDDASIHEINKTYRQIDKVTDVISFASLDDGDEVVIDGEIEIGDIFISIDTCKRQAEEYGHSFDRELCFLLTHGILHLLGYDHMNETDEKQMFSLQEEILNDIISR